MDTSELNAYACDGKELHGFPSLIMLVESDLVRIPLLDLIIGYKLISYSAALLFQMPGVVLSCLCMQDKEPLRLLQNRGYSQSQISNLGAT